jgi:hypothetical protein
MLLGVNGRSAHGNTFRLESDLREPEIQNLGMPVFGYKNVRGLDVAVNDALCVRRIQSIGNLEHRQFRWRAIESVRFPMDAPQCDA